MKIQKEYFEHDAFSNIKTICDQENAKKVLLIVGRNSFISSGAEKKLLPHLRGLEVITFDDFEVNPKLKDVYRGVSIVRTEKPDLIIAIGGGSVMDIAKLLNILSSQKIYSVIDLIMNPSLISTESSAPLLVIPTTSGTGSESTHFAVVYVDKDKYSVINNSMRPDYVILDPSLSYNLPKNIAASTALDALCQAIESFWSVNSTEESQQYAQQSIELILKFVESAVVDSNNLAKDAISKAANLAGKAINISKTTAPHALSYPITSYYKVPHGHAVALTLGKFFISNNNVETNEVLDPRGAKYLNTVMNKLFSMFDCDNAISCHDKWYSLVKILGLETDLKKLGISNSNDVQCIVSNVNIERMNNHPISLNNAKLTDILESMIN